MKKKTIQRAANGVKYSTELVSETAQTKSTELQLDAQHNALSNASEKSLENFKKLKSKQYVGIDLNEKGIFATIQHGGKFIVDCVKFSTYTQKMVENSGIVRYETDIYFPDTDERKLVGSITSLRKRVETQRKKLIKLGLL